MYHIIILVEFEFTKKSQVRSYMWSRITCTRTSTRIQNMLKLKNKSWNIQPKYTVQVLLQQDWM